MKKIDIKEYISQQNKVIKECIRVLKNQGSICWEIGNYVNNGEIIPLDILLNIRGQVLQYNKVSKCNSFQ